MSDPTFPLSESAEASALYPVEAGRIRTRSLEVHIVDHCNLRCAACCSLSPLLPKWWIAPRDLARDLELARRVLAPRWFKLVGGEPLLHPDIDDCLQIARDAAIAEIVSVTTNGFLLERMSVRFWQLVDALTISLYPEPRLSSGTREYIEARALEHDVRVNWKQQDEFVGMDRDAEREDEAETQVIYEQCWLRRRCHIVSRGAFYTCTRPPHFQTLHGNKADFLVDGLALHEGNGLLDELLAYLHRPAPLKTCALCEGGHAPALPHRQLSATEVRELVAKFR